MAALILLLSELPAQALEAFSDFKANRGVRLQELLVKGVSLRTDVIWHLLSICTRLVELFFNSFVKYSRVFAVGCHILSQIRGLLSPICCKCSRMNRGEAEMRICDECDDFVEKY